MERLTRREPENNAQQMLNYAYASETRVKLAYAGFTHGADLCEYIAGQAADMGLTCAPTPAEVMEGACAECDCVLGILNNVAIQAVELRARLMMIEDILGEEYDLSNLRNLLSCDQRGQRWIPVTERLPDKKGFYLTARKQVVHVEFFNEVIFSERNQMWQPTHWMPLPEPPREGE